MKQVSIFITMLLLLACEKNKPVTDDPVIPAPPKGIVAKWELTRYVIGLGGGGVPVPSDPNKPELIEFRPEGSFSANANCRYLKDYTSYVKNGTDKLHFFP